MQSPITALLIVPPFADVDRPSLAVHVLQACARQAGFRVDIFYANMLLASQIGVDRYSSLGERFGRLAGEWLFARIAHGLTPFESAAQSLMDRDRPPSDESRATCQELFRCSLNDIGKADLDSGGIDHLSSAFLDLQALEEHMPSWVGTVVDRIIDRGCNYQAIGCTTSFDQTNASIAILSEIRSRRPGIITILGGANCEGEMANGIASLDPAASYLDYIFAGESESTFPAFLEQLHHGSRPSERVVAGRPCLNLEAIPTPDYSEYFEQFERHLVPLGSAVERTLISYETSRGCWWGAKHHCTFCGLNGQGMRFRQKSPERVIADLQSMSETYPTRSVAMTDNIMPHVYFRSLLPQLAELDLPTRIFYEQKSNLTFEQVCALKAAGVVEIQPGIESLSSSLLKVMDKGVSAQQNVALLRYAKSLEIRMSWNLLWGFPGDEPASYDDTLALLPLIHHLQPPGGLCHLMVDRFSPYFDHPDRYGVRNIRPIPGYHEAFPPTAMIDKIAYHFVADYDCGAYRHMNIIDQIRDEVDRWRDKWSRRSDVLPSLGVYPANPVLGGFVLKDTRRLPGTTQQQWIDVARAAAVISSNTKPDSEEAQWAIAQKAAIVIDGRYVPLATAVPHIMERLSARNADSARRLPDRQPIRELAIRAVTA